VGALNLCTPQPNYVIVEQIHSKSGMPAIGGVIGPQANQVYRRIFQVCDIQDMFFQGKRISGFPSTWQYIQEFIHKGKQITTRPTGKKQLTIAYSGFKNLITPLPKFREALPESLTKQYDLGTPASPFIYGKDPIPQIQLYGNSKVEFITFGGNTPPTAVGVYKGAKGQLELPDPANRKKMIKGLLQSKQLPK
jgi:hypothetical protein